MRIGNRVGRFTVESVRVVGHNGGMGRARTRSGCCGGSVHTLSCRLRALRGMNVETRAIGSKCGVRYWGRDDIRNDGLTTDGDWGAWSDTFVWDGVQVLAREGGLSEAGLLPAKDRVH